MQQLPNLVNTWLLNVPNSMNYFHASNVLIIGIKNSAYPYDVKYYTYKHISTELAHGLYYSKTPAKFYTKNIKRKIYKPVATPKVKPLQPIKPIQTKLF